MKRKLKTLWSPNAASPGSRDRNQTCPNPPRRVCGLVVGKSRGRRTYLKGWVV